MARKPGGFSPAEINQALVALSRAGSMDDLKEIIETVPVIREPVFHAILRQEYLKLRNQQSPYLENFAYRYYDLFMLLHFRVHDQLFRSVTPTTPGPFQPDPFFAPSFFTELARILGDRVPVPAKMLLHPVRDMAQIREEVSKAVGEQIDLPAYEPIAGTSWSAVIVECAGCGQHWLNYRAYAVDLLQAPELIRPMEAERINHAACPYCHEPVCHPAVVWIQDGPEAGDILAALSCIWRLAPSTFCYQPPPGTPRVEDNDRILEIRCSRLKDLMTWPEPDRPAPAAEAEVTSLTIAYSQEELLHYFHQTEKPEDFSHEVLVEEMRRKVRSGLLPLYQAESAVREGVALYGTDWQLFIPGIPASRDADDLIVYLLDYLIAEGIAEAQQSPAGLRASLAAGTTSAFLMLGKDSLAEAALARAEDLLALVPPGAPNRELYETMVSNAKAEVLEAIKKTAEAEKERARVRSFFSEGENTGVTLMHRLVAQQLSSSQALMFYETQQYAEALKVYPTYVGELKNMLKEAIQSTDPGENHLEAAIRHSLSGDLANWAAILTDLAEHLETCMQYYALPAGYRQFLEAATGPFLAGEYIAEAMPVLESMFPEGVYPEQMTDRARQLLREALALSEAIGSWEFAGIQAHRLAGLLSNPEEAARTFEKAITYAARAGDHKRVWTAQGYLAELAMKKEEGEKALGYLEQAAGEWIREKVSSGFHAVLGSEILSLGDAVLRTVAMGADAVSAVAVVESLKAATTAASLSSGLPAQPMNQKQQPVTGRLPELIRQREQLRLQVMGNPGDEALKAVFQQAQEEIQEERRKQSLRDPRFGKWVDVTDLDLTDRRALLGQLAHFGPATTLLGMLVVGDQVWVYMVWAGGSMVTQRPLPAAGAAGDTLPAQDPRHRDVMLAGTAPGGVVPLWDEAYLAQLAEAVLTPVEKRLAALGPEDRLIISTSGVLTRVPFGALPFRGRPLVQHVNLNYIQSIGILEACLERPLPAFKAALCLGGPERPDMSELPGALHEVNEIEALFSTPDRKSRKFTGSQATVSNLRTKSGAFDVIHIAAHAMTGEGIDDASCLMLAPDPEEQDSGNLTEDRILFELLLQPGCLVNLAGCSTGTQMESEAPLLGGLIPAFLIAGASSVVGSLWPIDDRKAAAFQVEFYQQLLTGHSPAGSLSNTQRKCMDGILGEDMQHPSIWAAFVVYGVG